MSDVDKKIRVCFVAPKAYPIFNPDIESVFGGAEVDLYLIAKELAKDENFEVSFIVADYGQPNEEQRENVQIIKSLNFKQNSLISAWKIWKALEKADANWYMLETASPGVPLATMFCHLNQAELLYRTASQRECDGAYLRSHPVLGRLFIYSLKKSVQVVTQNQQGHDALLTEFGIDSAVIANGQRIPDISGIHKNSILWVGRSAAVKGPDRFIQLAQSLPDERFVMICQHATGDEHYDSLKAAAATVKNLEFIERIPFNVVDRYFEKSKVFVNTSDSEGFPNTFIQACKTGTCILSFGVNPDHFLDTYQCGITCNFNQEQMTETLKTLLQNEHYMELGRKGQRYVSEAHDITQIIEKYKDIFKG